MSPFNNDAMLITFSDLKRIFFKNASKIRLAAILCGLLCMAYLLLKEPLFFAESTFRQGTKQNEIGLSLRDAYQQIFSNQAESSTAVIMQSNEVLRNVAEELGLQAICNPDSFIFKKMKRIYENFRLELRRSISDPDPFIFRRISYSEEKPLSLFLKLINETHFEVLDQTKRTIGKGKLGEPFSCAKLKFTLRSVPKSAKIERLYPLTIQPWISAVGEIRSKLKVTPNKQDRSILRLNYSSRDRFFAADLLNQVMKSYQHFLKKENDESYQVQLAYLLQRQQELTQVYDEALVGHVNYLKESIEKSGFLGFSQELELLSQPKNFYTSKLFDVDLELQRLNVRKEAVGFPMKGIPYLDEKKGFQNRLENCDLDQKRLAQRPLLNEIAEVKEQLSEAEVLLQCVEKQEAIPSFPSLLKDPKSAIALLVKKISESTLDEPKIKSVRTCIDHLTEKQKMLEGHLLIQQQQSQDFSGLNLGTAQELLASYTRERDNLQAQLRELIFLRDQLARDDFEVSSLGGMFNDGVTGDLIQKAGAIALQLKDENNRSEREQARLLEALHTQKEFLSQHLLQTVELKKLRTKLLADKIASLCQTNTDLLQSEKQLIHDKLQELNIKMSDLPDNWRRESLLMLKKELGAMMLQGVSQLAEAKNLGQHIFQANSKPLDIALAPTSAKAPRILFFVLFASCAAALSFYLLLFCRKMVQGFPVCEESLVVAGFPVAGSLSHHCDVNLAQLRANDLETLRRMVAFLTPHLKKSEGLAVSCIGGNYSDYTMSLAEILSMRGLKVLAVNCSFDKVVHKDDVPGLWQFFNQDGMELPIKKRGAFDHLPSGGTTRHAAELFGSAKFSSFLSQVKQKYEVVLLLSSADARSSEGQGFLSLSDCILVSVQQEQKEDLIPFVNWGRKGDNTQFVYIEEEILGR